MAGILDSLLSGNADPGAGLLSFLNSLQRGAPASQMGPLPSDTAQYGGMPAAQAPVFAQQNAQPSPLDTAQYPAGPIGAPSQANAQMQQPAAQMPMQQVTAPIAPQPQAPAAQGPGFLDRVNANLQSLAHGGSLLGTLTGNLTDPASKAAQVQNLTFKALTAKGVDPQIAAAAIAPGNTEMLKTLITKTFGPQTPMNLGSGYILPPGATTAVRAFEPDDKFQHVTVKQFGGGETLMSYDPSTGKYTAGPSPSGVPGGAGFGSLLAQGVQYDPNKTGDDYMMQFSPEVQAATKAYMNGDVMPTGNARKDSIATFAKTVAQKVGQDKGIPVSDATYGAKRKMQIDLASSGNSSMGGILSNGESSFKHLAEYTKSAADQGNASHDFPLGGYLAYAQNGLGNSLGGSDVRAKIKAINDNLGHYGQESTKFYAGTGGGVEERMNALKEMNPTTTSGEEAAAYAEKEKSLMLDRLNTKFQEIRNTFGESQGNQIIAKHMPDIQANIATIDGNIAKLRGVTPASKTSASSAKPATVTQNGHTYNLQPDGSYQ